MQWPGHLQFFFWEMLWFFYSRGKQKDVKELKSDMLNIHPPIFQTAFPKIHVNTSRTIKQAFLLSQDSNHWLSCSEAAVLPTEL